MVDDGKRVMSTLDTNVVRVGRNSKVARRKIIFGFSIGL